MSGVARAKRRWNQPKFNFVHRPLLFDHWIRLLTDKPFTYLILRLETQSTQIENGRGYRGMHRPRPNTAFSAHAKIRPGSKAMRRRLKACYRWSRRRTTMGEITVYAHPNRFLCICLTISLRINGSVRNRPKKRRKPPERPSWTPQITNLPWT